HIHGLGRPAEHRFDAAHRRRDRDAEVTKEVLAVVVLAAQLVAGCLAVQLIQQPAQDISIGIVQTGHTDTVRDLHGGVHASTTTFPLPRAVRGLRTRAVWAPISASVAAWIGVISDSAVFRDHTHMPVSPSARLPAASAAAVNCGWPMCHSQP